MLRKVWKVQKKYDVNTPLLLNPHFSPIIEYWIEGGEWDKLTEGLDIGEGDIVRTFKRTVDLLRQLTVIPNVPRHVAQNAALAIENINRDPVSEAF